MKTRGFVLKTALLSALTLALCAPAALAETKVTVGVGHMCCDGCKTAAKDALSKVASDVSIDGTTLTITSKEDNLVPVIIALRTGGFPPTSIDAGSGPVTLAIAHMCCGNCKASLTKALSESKLEDLDMDATKVDMGTVTLKAKEGKTLDLVPVLAVIEKGGFEPTKITIGTAAASAAKAGKAGK